MRIQAGLSKILRINPSRSRTKPDIEQRVIYNPHRTIRWEGILSVCSIFISIIAIIFTYESQQLDIFYKEIAIKPRLVLEVFDENNAMRIRNDGTGPAIISYMSFIGKTDSINSGQLDTSFAAYGEKFHAYVVKMVRDALGNDFSDKELKDIVKTPNYSISSILPNNYKDIFTLDRIKILEILRVKYKKSPEILETRADAANHLVENIIEMYRIKVCYCSITGRYCSAAGVGPYIEDKEYVCNYTDESYTSVYSLPESVLSYIRKEIGKIMPLKKKRNIILLEILENDVRDLYTR